MQIRVGYELIYDCPQPTPMILTLNVHFTRVSDIVIPDHLITSPSIPLTAYRDGFGNWCSRIVAPQGRIRLFADGMVNDSGLPDEIVPSAGSIRCQDLPEETLVYLLGSRYCETDRLSETAWSLFGTIAARLGARPGHLRLRASATSPSATSMRGPPRRRGKPTTKARASAATMPISRSRSAAA